MLIGGAVVLLALFFYGILRLGPLAPVPVTVITVNNQSITPALYGIGTVGAHQTYQIGPISTGKLKRLDVDVGDLVRAGQVLGEMDPIDLDNKIAAQRASLKGSQAGLQMAKAQLRDATARKVFAETQAQRYEYLLQAQATSEETFATEQQSMQDALAGWETAHSNLDIAYHNVDNIQANLEALIAQQLNLNLVAPTTGLVTARNTNPGTTVIAGSPVVEMLDPKSLWVDLRFNQLSSAGLRAGLPVRIVLRSQSNQIITGHVLWVDPLADSVTEETLAKVIFDRIPQPLPPLGELAEATVALPVQTAAPTVPNASIQLIGGRRGVWLIKNGKLYFTPIKLGNSDLDGHVQIQEGIKAGDQIVEYSQRALTDHTRIQIVQHIPGVSP